MTMKANVNIDAPGLAQRVRYLDHSAVGTKIIAETTMDLIQIIQVKNTKLGKSKYQITIKNKLKPFDRSRTSTRCLPKTVELLQEAGIAEDQLTIERDAAIS